MSKPAASTKKKVNGSGTGIDALLTSQGRDLKPGEEIRFVLIKGPSSSRTLTPDPVNPNAPKEAFPIVAKFSESVVTPEFGDNPWSEARLYQRDVPKATDDSDDEADDTQGQLSQPKKRWRARKQVPRRQWVLQEQVEFLENMMVKRAGTGKEGGNETENPTSSVYEGLPERNSSHFILLETNDNSNDANAKGKNTIQVTVLPSPHAHIAFSQPKAIKAMTMSEAEQAIDDQRNKTSRFMMHDQQRIFQGQAPIHRSRTRLLGKLMAGADGDDEDGDEDDVMSDLTFRNKSSKGSAKARQELLNSFGDDMRVDADGVLGGGNDSIFGQRGQKFGHFSAGKDDNGKDKKDDTAAGPNKSSGNDGNAMADDFYKRDVQAEYEELDYDANEQFDDDDVDVGETDVHIADSNFGGIDDDEDDDLEDDALGERPTGAEGLASLAGFRLMLAKARGEITPEQLAELADKNKRQAEEGDKLQAENDRKNEDSSGGDHLAKIMEAAERARMEAESKMASVSSNGEDGGDNSGNVASKSKKKKNVVEVDENGQRLVTLEAVRHEIWLTRGKIPMKRLMKIFDVKKKSSADRQTKFKEAVRELCIIQTDPIGGRMLVLKQHYSRAN
ncbi:hypothetical protein FRACYDRAFT_209258 [Fragilariopsis cylindrus CCMP1102]|uniref:Transcription initiation factor IIF subunit alpha n=1 Tax=Fragilariopsis cylindrus CCMP1102 TaxID=635003 RepID=A0A1E7FCG6_9STRA|nr:hypothetical protein FRACYDRAFT_209258 [Fragilariopsis cylindrus CCMP1102]|eukprot:OEU15824.1 hypothetical protein FRACYDRAFT_209258 [Fragilariopsis cylindrus CCMP1102]